MQDRDREQKMMILRFLGRMSEPFARFGLFVIYAWFGLLKVFGVSPAEHLVQHLFERTIHFIPFDVFLILFGAFEVLIGVLFLVKGAERLVLPLLAVHMITTFLPLFFLPQETWSGFLVLTLEGQYIVKNLALMAAALAITAELVRVPNETKENAQGGLQIL